MAQAKKTKPREAATSSPSKSSPAPSQSHAIRETIESIVIAFVLAFLFRTFEAEAFVIPTGSMAPTLMGRHKDVDCPKCDFRFQVGASEAEAAGGGPAETLSGRCPMCRYVLPMRPDLPVPNGRLTRARNQPSYNGDRILVNKYLYTVSEPQRWDVVVFKYPGDANTNYIKRLVGLPSETLRVYQGNIFVGGDGASQHEQFETARKPPDKVLALRQPVHDTDYDPAELDAAGWPLRWHSSDEADGWRLEKSIVGHRVQQRYHVDRGPQSAAWLRYEHVVPDYGVWRQIGQFRTQPLAERPAIFAGLDRNRSRKLITDANPYNARRDSRRFAARDSLAIPLDLQGLHWVGDLMLEVHVEVESDRGELLLDLVRAGRHFTCAIDLASGEARLAIEGAAQYGPVAQTTLRGPGRYRVGFANVDDQLLLWVDGKSVSFDTTTAYDDIEVFGDRAAILPQTSDDDLGDLAPAGIGARDARLGVSRLRLWRDVYYIADDSRRGVPRTRSPISDYDTAIDFDSLFHDPARWDTFKARRSVDFPLGEDLFFVMGDNSAESSDARLWMNDVVGGQPGGNYLERRLLIGKALCVYWPHSWNRIPGTRIPFPLFPNFQDMRLVR